MGMVRLYTEYISHGELMQLSITPCTTLTTLSHTYERLDFTKCDIRRVLFRDEILALQHRNNVLGGLLDAPALETKQIFRLRVVVPADMRRGRVVVGCVTFWEPFVKGVRSVD